MIDIPPSATKRLSDLGLTARAGRNPWITGLAVDSRIAGQGALFAALAGSHSHGAQYIEQVLQNGAAAVLTDPAGAQLAAAALAAAILLTRSWQWPSQGWGSVTLVATLIGLGYTVFSEWLKVELRESWTYAAAMPRPPPWGTGLAPFL